MTPLAAPRSATALVAAASTAVTGAKAVPFYLSPLERLQNELPGSKKNKVALIVVK